MPAEYTMILKAFYTVEKAAVKLDGDFNFTEEVGPFVKKLIRQRFSLTDNFSRVMVILEDISEFLQEFPTRTQGVLRKLEEGHLAFEFRHRNLEKLVDEISRASNRISFALVILALLGASSVMITLGKTEVLWWAGLIGYSIAGVMGMILLFSILFRGRF
jgi:ubiquinone biosynthesis protein